MKFTIIEYHNDEDFDGDYHSIEVYWGSIRLRTYGDYYHDKGDLKAEAFCEGFAVALKEAFSIEYKNVYKELP